MAKMIIDPRIIEESGVMMLPKKDWVIQSLTYEPYYYNGVFYYGGFKFVFGSWDKGKIEQMTEVSTGAMSAKTDNKNCPHTRLLEDFFTRIKHCERNGKNMQRVVEDFLVQFYNNMDLWKIDLLLG